MPKDDSQYATSYCCSACYSLMPGFKVWALLAPCEKKTSERLDGTREQER